MLADVNRRRVQVIAVHQIKPMIERYDGRMMPDERAVADIDAALILHRAARIDKHVVADVDVLATVRVERRDQPERSIDRLACQLHEQLLQLLQRMICWKTRW